MTARDLPNVGSTYGAPMGRRETEGNPKETYKFSVRRVRINSGGYDSGGAYWGIGEPLYSYMAEGEAIGFVDGFLRARNRDDAIEQIRKQYPKATFYKWTAPKP